MQTLAESLGLPTIAERMGDQEAIARERAQGQSTRLVDISDPKAFACAVLSSYEFRQYIVNGLRFNELPSAIITRLMDYGWGKPVDRVEHTGKDGQPIATITEVRRVVVHTTATDFETVPKDAVH